MKIVEETSQDYVKNDEIKIEHSDNKKQIFKISEITVP